MTAPPKTKHATTDGNGQLILDWKDAVCFFAFVTGFGALFASLDDGDAGHASVAAALALAFGVFAPVVRRLLVGGPAPVVRDGFLWGLARVVGGVALFLGFFCGFIAAVSPQAPMVSALVAVVSLAVGATIDHVVRTPKDEDP